MIDFVYPIYAIKAYFQFHFTILIFSVFPKFFTGDLPKNKMWSLVKI